MGRTDFDRVDSDEELARQEASDPDLAWIPKDWILTARIERGLPVFPIEQPGPPPVSISLDATIVDFFKIRGSDWQEQINLVLKSFVDSQVGRRKVS